MVTIPAIMIPQPSGGYLVNPGRPVVEEELISSKRAAQLLGVSQNYIGRMVEAGLIEAERPGKRWLKIRLRSVLARKAAEV